MSSNKEKKESARAKNKKIDIEINDKDKTAKTSATQEDAAQPGQSAGDNNKPETGTKKDPLQEAQEALAAEKDKYLRLAAEYDNFRKRSAKERDSIYINSKADVIGKLLPVYDNLERALKTECADEAYYKGIEMTMQQLTDILKNMNVMPIETTGQTFDPNKHNALARIEDKSLGENVVAEECKKGFIIGERVIRFADVIVAN